MLILNWKLGNDTRKYDKNEQRQRVKVINELLVVFQCYKTDSYTVEKFCWNLASLTKLLKIIKSHKSELWDRFALKIISNTLLCKIKSTMQSFIMEKCSKFYHLIYFIILNCFIDFSDIWLPSRIDITSVNITCNRFCEKNMCLRVHSASDSETIFPFKMFSYRLL